MLTSFALIFLMGLAGAELCRMCRLPRIIGMLLVGILMGPCVLNWLDPTILEISGQLRKMALVIILMKAGLSLKLKDLKQVGRPAILMSFLPASFEVAAVTFLAPRLLGISVSEAALMGTVLAAVSPAVVVPKMVSLMEEKWGTEKSIPQMILAGASLDDVFVILMFTSFLGMAQGETAQLGIAAELPIAIAAGILLGGTVGVLLAGFFDLCFKKGRRIRNTTKLVLLLGTAFLLIAAEDALKGQLALSGLLAVMSMAVAVQMRSDPVVSGRLTEKVGKLWIAAEVILFVLVGAAVDIRYAAQAGGSAVLLILLALLIRSIGTMVCVLGTHLNWRERLFCIIAYLPKATVQAAIGSVPLAAGLPCGQLILTVAVAAILITAPMGALGMDCSYKRLLQKEKRE